MIDFKYKPEQIAKRAKADHENRIVVLPSTEKKYLINRATAPFFYVPLGVAIALFILSFYFANTVLIWASVLVLSLTLAVERFVLRPKVKDNLGTALNHLNSHEAPHQVIKDFIHWKRGDRVCVSVRSGNYCANFKGVTDDMRIVLKSGSTVYILPPNYLKHVLNENVDLQKRKKQMIESDVETEIVENAYMDFLQTARNELQKQNDSKSTTNQESKTTVSN